MATKIGTPVTQGAQNIGGIKVNDAANTPFQNLQTSADMFAQGPVSADSSKKIGGALITGSEVLNAIEIQNNKAAANTAFRKKQTEFLSWGLDAKSGGVFTKNGTSLYGDGTSPTDQLNAYGAKAAEYGKSGAEGLKNDAQRKLFNSLWSDHAASASSRASTHLTSEWTKYEAESRGLELSNTSESFALQFLPGVTDYFQSTHKKALDEIFLKKAELERGGHSAKDVEETISGMTDHLSSSVVRSYVKQSGGSITALTELAGGSFSDPVVQVYWNRLSDNPKEQENIQRDLVRQYTEIAKVNKSERDDIDRVDEAKANQLELDFYRETDPVKRRVIAGQYEDLNKAKPSVMKQLRQELAGGTVSLDFEPGLLELEELIADGTITTITEAKMFQATGHTGRVGTPETFRTRILPLLERNEDKRFTTALRIGRASLGIVEGGVTNTVTSQRVGDLTAKLLSWSLKPENKNADPVEQMEKLVREAKERYKLDPETKQKLDVMYNVYLSMLQDPKEAADAGEFYQNSVGLLLSQAGMTPAEYLKLRSDN